MSSSTSPAAAAPKLSTVEKIRARVFCGGPNGGNPVTIFASEDPLSKSLQEQLAKSCEWESVMVSSSPSLQSQPSSSPRTSPLPTMAFFMPSGEEVSFCAHAAIGGAIAMGKQSSTTSWNFQASMTGDEFVVDTSAANEDETGGGGGSSSSSRMCCLRMHGVSFEEVPLGHSGTKVLHQWATRLGWNLSQETTTAGHHPLRNASVARPKTLVEMASVDALHQANIPPIGDGSFAKACGAMDDSTGIYLYAPNNKCESSHDSLSYECRQFPRSSGYPEDPATGIAAAALAASLRFGTGNAAAAETIPRTYNVYQGTAMGRPSLIQVVDLQRDDDPCGGDDEPQQHTLSFGLQGMVEVDDAFTLRLDDEQ